MKFKTGGITTFFELAAGMAVLIAVNLIWWPERPAFIGVQPHPYWILILPLAVYYGFKHGVLSAVLSALVYLGWTFYASPEPNWILYFNFERVAPAFFFVAAGLVLGELRERHRRDEDALRERLDKVEDALLDLSVAHQSLQEAKRELELNILSQEQTVQTLYKAADNLRRLDEAAIYPGIVELLIENLGATQASIYTLGEGAFNLLVHNSQDEGSVRLPGSVPSTEGLMGYSLMQRDVAHVNMVITQDGLSELYRNPILITAPLILEDGRVVGMVNVNRLPFLKFTPETVRMVGLLANWASIAISNARKHKEVEDRNIDDPITGAYNPGYLIKRLEEEYARARRYGMLLSLVMVKVVDFDEIDDTLTEDVLTVLGNVFQNAIRNVDLLFRYKGDDTFVLLLPATPGNMTYIVQNRITDEIQAFRFKPYRGRQDYLTLKTGSCEFSKEMQGFMDMLNVAEERMEQNLG
jgi:diguanylate cyclase (GGDEF)-like protein